MDEKIIIMNDLKNILMYVYVIVDIFIFGVIFKLIYIKIIIIIVLEYIIMKCFYKV